MRVALTREDGQNEKLRQALEAALRLQLDRDGSLDDVLLCTEIPCIRHGPGPDGDQLRAKLKEAVAGSSELTSIVLTSPQAARVFLEAWADVAGGAGEPFPLLLVCVGAGTSAVLSADGQEVAWEPSKANAETLAAELPERFGPGILYPASAKAADTLVEGLRSRGFEGVERLNTYTTMPASSFDAETLLEMEQVAIVTFGSPSAVRAWAESSSSRPTAACIGSTSQKAAVAAGFSRVLAPEKPGVAGWAQIIAEEVAQLMAS